MKYPPGTIIDLNQADTTELKKIPGIGSRIARSIVNHRRLLGGFYQIEQLGEIRLKAEKLRSWFSVDAGKIHRININKASVERMMHHPYISYYQAKVIAEYRKKKGKVRDLKQLMLYEEFTPADFERMAPMFVTTKIVFVVIYKKRCIPITPDKNASHTNKTNTLLTSSQTYVEKRL